MSQKMRRVPQEAFLSTARIFRTIEGPLRYRIPLSQNEKASPAATTTTAIKEEANAKSAARLTGENKKRTTSKSFSFQFGVRCGARTHDTQNHNLVLYQLN